jgi:hypothetical protein
MELLSRAFWNLIGAGLTNQAQELEVNNKNVKEFYKPGSS